MPAKDHNFLKVEPSDEVRRQAQGAKSLTIGLFALAEASIAQVIEQDGNKKAPPKRTTKALSDPKSVPEPR